MKKYFTLIIIGFWVLLLVLFNQNSINNYFKEQKIKQINNSIVKIIYNENFKLNQENKLWFKNIKETNIKENKLIWNWFFITNNWVIITNKHIANNINWEYIIQTNDKKIYKAKLIYIDKNNDISILKINSNKYKKLDINYNIFTWETIYKIWTNIEKWIIINKDNKKIITTLNLENWDSWTALFNRNFKVIWINTAKSNKLNNSYAIIIPKNIIKKYIKN